VNWTDDHLLLITGATGFIGGHVARAAIKQGIRTRALVRRESRFKTLQENGVQVLFGSMSDPYSLKGAVADATHVVHCAARVGDWGPVAEYREVNVQGLESLLEAAVENKALQRFVHLSSLGVYEARDHHGTDETEPIATNGIGGYAQTKIEAENLVQGYVKREKLPAIILRPGFVYGPRDRAVLPRVLSRLKNGRFRFIGSGEQVLNNVYVGNAVDAIFKALECEDQVGQAFNITDGRLVSRLEFIHTICDAGGYKRPEKHVPLGAARTAAIVLETIWKALGITNPPTPSQAIVKFLGYNLDYSIEKARRELGYDPQVDFADGMKQTMAWARKAGLT
jgi:nucleoside-diphosphate-sugar epimerase